MGLFDYSNQLFDGRFVEEDVLKNFSLRFSAYCGDGLEFKKRMTFIHEGVVK